MELIFRRDLKQKLAPTKAVTYPRNFLLTERWKKVRALGTRCKYVNPPGMTYLRYTTTYPKQLQVIEVMGKIKLQLKRSANGIYIVEIWM